MLISFSGLDGAGKSTLIDGLRRFLESEGRRVRVLAVYDHVGVYAAIRAIRDRLRGAPGRTDVPPGLDRLQEMQLQDARRGAFARWGFRVIRSARMKRFIYLVDLLLLHLYRGWFEGIRREVLILDRYLYDSLADIAQETSRAQLRRLARAAPEPDLPIFVDVSPQVAYSRKGEYPLEYLERRRTAYIEIFSCVRRPLLIANDTLDETLEALRAAVVARR